MINRFAAVSGWVLLAAIALATLSPINLRPQTGHAFLERFLAFAALGTAFSIGYPRRISFAVGVIVLSAIGLEAAQMIAPGRHARVVDAAEKLAGGAVGLLVGAACVMLISHLRPQHPARIADDPAP